MLLKSRCLLKWLRHPKFYHQKSTKMDSKSKNPGVRRRIEKFRRYQTRCSSRLHKLEKVEVADVARDLRLHSIRKRPKNSQGSIMYSLRMLIIRGWWPNTKRCKINKCLNQLQCLNRSLSRCKCQCRHHRSLASSQTRCKHSLQILYHLQCHNLYRLPRWIPSRNLNKMP